MKLWSCYTPDYIENFLHNLKEGVVEINIWQNIENLREQYTGAFVQVDTNECSLKLDEKHSKSFGRINVQQPIFIHCAKADMLCRIDMFKIDSGVLTFKTPHEVKFRDKRVSSRFSYKYQDFKSITFTLKNDPKIHSHILTGVSTAGASFVLPQLSRKLLGVGDEVLITGLSDQELEAEHSSRVVYIEPFKISREGDSKLLQVGVEFAQGLDTISYRSISNIVKKKQQKVRGLHTDMFNGLNPDEFNKAIIQIKSKNPQLAANIKDKAEDLDRLRYLTTEMKREFLLAVNHDVLATALRMSSKELIFDLLIEVTDSMRDEFLEKLDIAKPASAVNKAQDQISTFIRSKEATGELILDPRSYIKMV